MKNLYLLDFYRGWVIEIIHLEQGFQAICHSPHRSQLTIQSLHASDADVLHAAKQKIDYQVTCSSLIGTVQEFYEEGFLNFEEWHALQHSLKQPVNAE